jgi:hypothetical protein
MEQSLKSELDKLKAWVDEDLRGKVVAIATEEGFLNSIAWIDLNGIYESSAQLILKLVETFDQQPSLEELESYIVKAGVDIRDIVWHWRSLLKLLDLKDVFEDSDLVACPNCGKELGQEDDSPDVEKPST